MMYFSRYLRFTAFLFLILSLASSCIREKLVLGEDRISVGDYLPEFEVSVNDGRQISTSDLSGKISVIVFFNTDCPDCRQLMPEIQKLYEMYSDAGDIVILAVSREQDYESVSGYWEKNNYSIPFSAQDGDPWLQTATREEAIVAVMKQQDVDISNVNTAILDRFTGGDSAVTSTITNAEEYVAFVVSRGLVNGTGTSLALSTGTNRGEIGVLVYRVLIGLDTSKMHDYGQNVQNALGASAEP